ncbi:MAG: OmpA family protein [Bacteroidota bacterium]|nr:OmpA family protein [Bacteroidota bacterium]
MNLNLTKPTMLALLCGLASPLLAQQDSARATTTNATMTQTQVTTTPFSTDRFGRKNFRTWSIGIQGGVLTPYTIFRGNTNDFNTSQENWGYGGYIKKQISPGFGLQADFLAGNVEGKRASSAFGSPNYDQTSFKSHIKWSAALTGNLTLASFNINRINSYFSPYLKAGAGYMQSNAELMNLTASKDYTNNWFIPVGAGLKIGISKGINLDLGYDVNFVKSASFDGVSSGSYDKFSYGHFGLEFILGNKKNQPLSRYSAIADLRQQNADQANDLKNAMTKAEQNAQMMKDQYSNDKAQLMKDMADDDGDGVANKYDKCPGTVAGTVVDGSGCPIVVTQPVIKETQVIVTEQDRKVVDSAIHNLEFDLSKATIKTKSFASLNSVANLLVQKNFSLKLAGHTDNSGSMALNMRLSKERAEAVKAYLVAQGANASRIEATGYGPTQPIANNKTEEGRQKNRRVEFTLF